MPDVNGGNAGPDAPAGAEAKLGSRRRSQWVAPPHVPPVTAAAEVPSSGSPGPGGPAGPARGPRKRGTLIAIAAVLTLVAGITIAAVTATAGRPGKSTTGLSSASDVVPGVAPDSGAPTMPALGKITTPAVTAASPSAAHSTPGPTASSGRVSPDPNLAVGSGPPQPIGSWPLNSGSGVTALDTVGHHNGVAENITWVGASAQFNGTDSSITVPEQVVDTGPGKSFTVVADVFQYSTSGFYTFVSQDGSLFSGFYLEYSGVDNRWAFTRQGSDAIGTTPYRALSVNPPQLNTWTSLVGVYNGANGQLQLYVNEQPQGVAVDPTPYATSGDLVFGRSLAGGAQGGWLPGLICNVKIFNRALTGAQIQELKL